MAHKPLNQLLPNTVTDIATKTDTKTEERRSTTNVSSDHSNNYMEIDSGQRSKPTPDYTSHPEKRLEEEKRKSLTREATRDVCPQTSSSAATKWKLLALPADTVSNPDVYDSYRNQNCVPSTSFVTSDSPSARLTTSTLTRDVPDLSEEPLAAVDVGKSFPTASTPSYFSTKRQSIPTSFPTNLGSESNKTAQKHNFTENNDGGSILFSPPSGRPRRGEVERVVTSPLPVLGVDVWGDRNGASHERLASLHTSRNPVEPNCNTPIDSSTIIHPHHPRSRSVSSDGTVLSNNHLPSFAMQWNISGIRSHLSELQILTTKHEPTVISLQETNMDSNRLPGQFLGNKYDLLLSQCSTHGRQGAGIAIKIGTPFQRISLQTNIQAVAVQLYAPMKITVVSIYLPPKVKDAANLLSELLEELPKPVLLMGDLNAHHVAWGSRIGASGSEARKRGNQILDIVIQNDMLVLNDGSHTRVDPITGNTQALDISACSTSVAAKFEWKILPDCADSDHLPILIDMLNTSSKPAHRARWMFEKADWVRYEDLTSSILRPEHFLTVEEFSDKLISAAEACIPKTTGKSGPKSVVWWNEDIKSAVKQRRKRLRALRRLSSDDPRKPDALKQFQEARSICRKIIEEAKQKCWIDFVESINPSSSASQVWNKLNRLQGKKN